MLPSLAYSGAEFGKQRLVVCLLVGQALSGVVFFSFQCSLGGGQFRSETGQLGTVLGGLSLPVLDVGLGPGQLH